MNTKEAKKLLRKAKDNARLGNGGGKLVTSLRKQGLSEDEIGIRVGRKTCTITLEDVLNQWELQDGRCGDSNVVIDASLLFSKRNPWAPSIDRVDNKIGYEPGNIRIVLSLWNTARGETPIGVWKNKLKQFSF